MKREGEIPLRAKLYRVTMVRWVDIPKKSVTALGDAKPLNAYLYFNDDVDRVTLMPGKRGCWKLAFKVELLKAAGVDAGDTIEFSLSPDRESRVPDIPDEMQKEFSARPYLLTRWNAHSVAIRRQIVRYILQAKSPETQLKRCWIFLERLEETGKLSSE